MQMKMVLQCLLFTALLAIKQVGSSQYKLIFGGRGEEDWLGLGTLVVFIYF